MKKKMTAMMIAALTLTMSLTAFAAAPAIREVEVKKNVIEVDFAQKVQYQDAQVTVQDANGMPLSVQIIERDKDEIDFRVDGLNAGTEYTYTISGVRSGKSGSYERVSGTFRTAPDVSVLPPWSTAVNTADIGIRSVEYDREDAELEIEFLGAANFENPTVTVTDEAGSVLEAAVIETDLDDIDAMIFGLVRGQTYVVTVSGVAKAGSVEFGSVSAAFTVN